MHERRSFRRSAWSSALALGTAGCVSLPDPPPPPEDLSALGASYDQPTALLTESRVNELIQQVGGVIDFVELLTGLHVVRTLISETSTGLGDGHDAEETDLQGSVRATVPCFGDGPEPTADGALNGTVSVTFGLVRSRLRRGFEGGVDRCRFRVETLLGVTRVVVSADLVADMGADLGVGSELTRPILVRLRDMVGSSSGDAGDLDLSRAEFDFRLTADGSVETLIDLADLGAGDAGSAVLALRVDGSIAVRDSQSEWSCATQESPCALVR